ncbi:MAG: hypothetical protein LBM77_10730 [Spirochaetaceae bacterium]|jgi:hypothetical protein|nr:hypothetical protein [Spirochaetaceae bacterium]
MLAMQSKIEIPASHHLEFDVPRDIPVGQAYFYLVLAESPSKYRSVREKTIESQSEKADAFGIWKDRPISLKSIREKAWSRHDVSV